MATVQWQAPHLNIEYSVGHGGMGAGAFEARSRTAYCVLKISSFVGAV